MNTLPKTLDNRLQSAIHEAGHLLLCNHFGLEAKAWLFNNEGAEGHIEKLIGGTCFTLEGTPFQKCVVGWGGYLAEKLFDPNEQDAPLDYLVQEYFDSLDEQSESDVNNIYGHNQKWRAAKLAWKILSENKQEVEQLAFQMIAEFESDFVA